MPAISPSTADLVYIPGLRKRSYVFISSAADASSPTADPLRLHIQRRLPVDDNINVWLIDTLTIGISGHHDVDAILPELLVCRNWVFGLIRFPSCSCAIRIPCHDHLQTSKVKELQKEFSHKFLKPPTHNYVRGNKDNASKTRTGQGEGSVGVQFWEKGALNEANFSRAGIKQMGGCQNNGPFFGTPNIRVPYYTKDPKRTINLDIHPDSIARLPLFSKGTSFSSALSWVAVKELKLSYQNGYI